MGVVISRLWTTKRSFREHLEHLESEIKRIEIAQQRNAIIKRQLISSIVLWSSILYIISFVAYYLLAFPHTWTERVLYAVPFFIAPFIIHFINRYAYHLLSKKYTKYGEKLVELRDEKKKVLEEVIETESFKNAKELLERFDPQSTFLLPSQMNTSVMMTPRGNNAPQTPHTGGMELRRRCLNKEPSTSTNTARPVAAATPQPRPSTPPKRHVKPQRKLQKPQGEVTPTPKPLPKVMSSCATQTTPAKSDKLIPTGVANRTPQVQIVREYLLPGHVKNERAGGPPQPLQLLPAERSSVDKLVEFVIGDGPNNRFALICSQCHSHNGMVLQEDFEYTTFRCAYCFTVNPARRNNPVHQQVYKLPNVAVKPPKIVKEISSNEEVPDEMEEKEKEISSEEETDDKESVHETPDKDITDLLEDLEDIEDMEVSTAEANDVTC